MDCQSGVTVVESTAEITDARKELRRQSISCLSPWPLRTLRKLGLVKGINIGDYIKSWDVLKTAAFIQNTLTQSSSILDIGAYASEILYVLHRLKYTALTGVDLNANIKAMPYADSIRFVVADFMHTPFEDESFEAITAISVIDHGFQIESLLKGVSRLLHPGGYFIASFD